MVKGGIMKHDIEIPVTKEQIGSGIGLAINYSFEGFLLWIIVAGILNALEGGTYGGTMIGLGAGMLVLKNAMVRYLCFDIWNSDSESKRKKIRKKRELYAYHWHVLKNLIPFKLRLKQ